MQPSSPSLQSTDAARANDSLRTEGSRRTSSTWVRYAGLVAIVAAVLQFLDPFWPFALSDATTPGTTDSLVYAALGTTLFLFAIVGMSALYVRHADSLGLTGKAGLFAMVAGALVAIAFVVGAVGVEFVLLNNVLVVVGSGLLAVSLRRIPEVPRVAAFLLGLMVVATVVGFAAFAAVPAMSETLRFALGMAVITPFSAAWAVLGYHLWHDTPSPTAGRSAAVAE